MSGAREWQGLIMDPEGYCDEHRAMLAESHYLALPPPGCLFAVGVRAAAPGLFGPIGVGSLRGVCLVGRPVARMLPQDGTVGEVTRLVLLDGLPYATASALLRRVAELAREREMAALISYHDRTRHTGTIYRKAGFKKDGGHEARTSGWGSRAGRASAGSGTTPKRRWRLDLSA